jgi:hypothetical protein
VRVRACVLPTGFIHVYYIILREVTCSGLLGDYESRDRYLVIIIIIVIVIIIIRVRWMCFCCD